MGRTKGSWAKFEGLPLRDAKAPFTIPLLQVDIDNAERFKDVGINDARRFKQCVVAQACGRMLGEEGHVRINRSTAYVTWEGADHALRYQLTPTTRRIVEAFDRSKRSRAKIKPGQVLQFVPPAPGDRLEAIRARSATRYSRSGSRTGRLTGVRRRNVIDINLRHGAFAK